jgi:threonine/homoserine/homoserine lactone efflux protein
MARVPMSTTQVLAFLAAAVPAFFTPGPNNLMLMASTARFGFGRTLPHALGVVVGFPLMTVILGLGLSELFTAYPLIKDVLKWAAGGYLLWMAWTLLGLKVGSTGSADRPLRFHEAALFQWINPKAWVMAVALVTLVVQPGENRQWTLAALGLGCLLLAPLSTWLWMAFGTGLEQLLRRARGERFLGAVLATLMIVAVVLFLL